RHRASGRAIRAEQAELERVRVVHRLAVARGCGGSQHDLVLLLRPEPATIAHKLSGLNARMNSSCQRKSNGENCHATATGGRSPCIVDWAARSPAPRWRCFAS